MSAGGQTGTIRRFLPGRAGPEADADSDTPPPPPPLELPFPPLLDLERGFSLRPWGVAPTDAGALRTGWADPDVQRWTSVPEDTSQEAAERWVRGEERRRQTGRSLDLVIARFDQPEQVLGEVGLVVVEHERRWAEVGWWLLPESRGAGRAAAALALFSEWVLRTQPVARAFARTDPANPAAGRVASRAGFHSVGRLDDGPEVWVRDA